MVRTRNLLLLLILILCVSFAMSSSVEGFYTDANISSATSQLNSFKTSPLTNLREVVTGLSTQQYRLDLNPVVATLKDAFTDKSSNLNENEGAIREVNRCMNELSVLQSNTISINNTIADMMKNIKVDYKQLSDNLSVPSQYISLTLTDVITQLNNDIQVISNRLDKLPDKA